VVQMWCTVVLTAAATTPMQQTTIACCSLNLRFEPGLEALSGGCCVAVHAMQTLLHSTESSSQLAAAATVRMLGCCTGCWLKVDGRVDGLFTVVFLCMLTSQH
jgi:hypothetical protein